MPLSECKRCFPPVLPPTLRLPPFYFSLFPPSCQFPPFYLSYHLETSRNLSLFIYIPLYGFKTTHGISQLVVLVGQFHPFQSRRQ